jgi:hypothetical protein
LYHSGVVGAQNEITRVSVCHLPDMDRMSWKALSVSELPVLQLMWGIDEDVTRKHS